MTASFDVQGVARRIAFSVNARDGGFPLDVELAALHFPVSVVAIERLSPARIDDYLSEHMGWPIEGPADSRMIRGCLVANRGHGIIFVEATETEEARRFTLAHELAHFIGHYLARREYLLSRLGSSIAAVLDGARAPTPAERLSGLLAQAPLGVFRDVLERDGGSPVSLAADRMEYEADAAAFAAIAPIGEVLRLVGQGRGDERSAVIRVLVGKFGLARHDAERHAPAVLQAARRNAPSFLQSLEIAAASRKARERSKRGKGEGR